MRSDPAQNRIRSLLAQRLIHPPMPTLFGVSGRQWLREVELAPTDRMVIDGFLRLLTELEAEEARIEQRLAELSYPLPEVRLLLTLPGVGPAAAQALIAALGDWRRFADGDAAASYLGLTPRVRQSAERCHYGPITKAGNSQARWLLTQAAQQVAQHPGPLGVFFRRLKAKKNHNVAVVATARKLVVIAHLMLKNQKPYRYAVPSTTQGKLLPCESTPPANVEASPVRCVSRWRSSRKECGCTRSLALNEVYGDEGLPTAKPLSELARGELRVLGEMKALDHAAKVQTRQRRLCKRS